MTSTISILYVDDEESLLELGRVFLENTGDFRVTLQLSAVAALESLKSHHFDAIVSDYQMPDMDGLEFLKQVRSDYRQIPFILFTGRGREEVVIAAINNGVDFYLQKGGDPMAQFAELAHKIRHAVSRQQTAQALKRSERDYRHLIEHANEAIYVVQDRMIRMTNSKLADMTGYSKDELAALPMTTFIHPDDRPMILERYERRQRGEAVPSRYPFRLFRKDRTTYWVELSGVVISWDSRPATLVFLTDITERKQAEDALRESEEQSWLLLSTIPDIVIVHQDGIITYVNAMTVEKTGFSQEELLNSQISSYVMPEDRDIFLSNIDRVKRGSTPDDYEIRIVDKSGGIHDVIVRSSPILFNHKPSVVVILIDITERKKAEQTIRESEDLYRTIFETTGAATILIGEDTTILKANSGFATLSGFPVEELEGKKSWTEFVMPEDLQRMIQYHRNRRIHPSHEVRIYEFRFINHHGQVRKCINNVRVIPGTRQSIASVVDISDRIPAIGDVPGD